LYRKFTAVGVRPVIPLTLADVRGIVPGVSAHVSLHGYLPATPVVVRGEVSRLFLLWVDDEQAEALDLTEPNYHRRSISSGFPARLVSGIPLPEYHLYVGKHGHLADPSGVPLRLHAQPDVIARLLSLSAKLRQVCGSSPEEFVARVKDPAIRQAAYALFRTEGLVQDGESLTRSR
jgi:hypothetical protein